MNERESFIKLQELVDEGVLEETGPKEFVITNEFFDLVEKSLKDLRKLQDSGEELPEDLLKGATFISYIKFRGAVSETELPLKVSLITTCLEIIRDRRLEEWTMKTRIRRM